MLYRYQMNVSISCFDSAVDIQVNNMLKKMPDISPHIHYETSNISTTYLGQFN